MPSTEDADKMFRGLVAGLSPSALYGRLLKEEDLARRFVAAVNMIADGNVPRTVVAFMAPHGRFSVHEREGRTFVDPKGFARYDAVASVVASLDVGGTARAYAALHPLLDSAYSQIGKPGTTLDGRLTEAIQRVVSPSASAEPMELVASGVIYKFADAKVEGLPSCTKQLLRMGPTNMQLIQDKLRDVASALHLTLVAVAPAGAEASPR